MKKIFFQSYKGYIVGFAIMFIIFFTYMFGNMTEEIKTFEHLLFYIDGFFIAGFACVCVGGLVAVHNMGAFDTFSYAFGGRKKTKAASLNDYSLKQEEKRKNNKFTFVPYLVDGLFACLIAFILYLFL